MSDKYTSPLGVITSADDLDPVDLSQAETEFEFVPKAILTQGAGNLVLSMKDSPDVFHTIALPDGPVTLALRVAKVKGTAGGTTVTKVWGMI